MKSFERKVKEVEGFDVKADSWEIPPFDYKRAAPSKLTVSQWIKKRCGGEAILVYDGDGKAVHGRTQLSTVRNSYYE